MSRCGRACRCEVVALRRALRRALHQIDRLAGALETERDAAGADEVRQHPTLLDHARRIYRARRTAEELHAILGLTTRRGS